MRFPLELSIAGVSYHCTSTDEGSHTGYIKAEPNNQYDSNAIGIYSEGKLYGYIPKEQTLLVRLWGKGKTDFKCEFTIWLNDSIRDGGTVTIIDESFEPIHLSYTHFAFGVGNRNDKIDPSDFGIKNCNSKEKVIDYFVTDDPDSVPVSYSKRNLPLMTYSDFYEKLFAEVEDNEWKGKNICIPFKINDEYTKLIEKYLIYSGANVSNKYSKNTTDIVIDREAYGKLKVTEKAEEEEGKVVYMLDDIYRKLGVTTESKKPTNRKSNIMREPDECTKNSGCLLLLVVALSSLLLLFI